MPAQLPTTDTLDRAMNVFGNGTYDRGPESEFREEGDFEARGESLPTQKSPAPRLRDPDDPVGGEQFSPVSDAGRCSSASLPGDYDRPPRAKHKPEDSTIQTVVESAAAAELPHDKNNPPARSDYYDQTKVGETQLPGVPKNEETMDKVTGGGNAWSGWELDDLAQVTSFPGTDRSPEEADKYTSVPVGSKKHSTAPSRAGVQMRKISTNLELVGTLTSDFIKKAGKSGITRRHVMAFLQENGYHQYLASDIIRCLQHRHNVHVADVLDQFPVSSKVASIDASAAMVKELSGIGSRMASIVASDVEATKALQKCEDSIVESIADLMRGLNG